MTHARKLQGVKKEYLLVYFCPLRTRGEREREKEREKEREREGGRGREKQRGRERERERGRERKREKQKDTVTLATVVVQPQISHAETRRGGGREDRKDAFLRVRFPIKSSTIGETASSTIFGHS